MMRRMGEGWAKCKRLHYSLAVIVHSLCTSSTSPWRGPKITASAVLLMSRCPEYDKTPEFHGYNTTDLFSGDFSVDLEIRLFLFIEQLLSDWTCFKGWRECFVSSLLWVASALAVAKSYLRRNDVDRNMLLECVYYVFDVIVLLICLLFYGR